MLTSLVSAVGVFRWRRISMLLQGMAFGAVWDTDLQFLIDGWVMMWCAFVACAVCAALWKGMGRMRGAGGGISEAAETVWCSPSVGAQPIGCL